MNLNPTKMGFDFKVDENRERSDANPEHSTTILLLTKDRLPFWRVPAADLSAQRLLTG
jgi:hypothetical protein